MSKASIEELKRQREVLREHAIGSTNPYDIFVALAISDDAVFDRLASKLEEGVITGAVLLREHPIALIEFEFMPNLGVNLTCNNVMVGIHPDTLTVSLDTAAMFDSEEEPASSLPLTLRIASEADRIGHAYRFNSALSDRELEYREKVGVPLPEDGRGLGGFPLRLTQPVGFGPFGPLDGFGRRASASPGTQTTKCFTKTYEDGVWKDGWHVADDCG